MSLVKNKQTKIYTHEKKNFISSPFPESRLRLNRRIKACYCVFFNNCLHFYEMREYKKSVTILARLLCIVKCLFLAVLLVFTQNLNLFLSTAASGRCSYNRSTAEALPVCQEPPEQSRRSACPLLVCVPASFWQLWFLEGMTVMRWNKSILCDTECFHLLAIMYIIPIPDKY